MDFLSISNTFQQVSYGPAVQVIDTIMVRDYRLIIVLMNSFLISLTIVLSSYSEKNNLLEFTYLLLIYQVIVLFHYNLLPFNKNHTTIFIKGYNRKTMEPELKKFKHYHKGLELMTNLGAKQYYEGIFNFIFLDFLRELGDWKRSNDIIEKHTIKKRLFEILYIKKRYIENNSNWEEIGPLKIKFKTLLATVLTLCLIFWANFTNLSNILSNEVFFGFEIVNYSFDLMFMNFPNSLPPLINLIVLESFNYVLFILLFSFIITYSASLVGETVISQRLAYKDYMMAILNLLDEIHLELILKSPNEVIEKFDFKKNFSWAISKYWLENLGASKKDF